MFGTILISVITFMHIYVFWRAVYASFPNKKIPKKILIPIGVFLWILFYLGRVYGHHGNGTLAKILELAGMNWMASVFLIFFSVLIIDIVTCFGLFFRSRAASMRGLAIVTGIIFSVIALVQGLRPPVIESYDVYLSDLPKNMENTVLIAMSDLHLGSLLGPDWLKERIKQVNEQNPDLIVLVGDIFEGHNKSSEELLEVMNTLSAPLGVWAVYGNHEFHRRRIPGRSLMERAKFKLLRNSWIEIKPGFILAGVDDLTSMRRRFKQKLDFVSKSLNGRPKGATIFLSHTPWEYKKAAGEGVGLMLCGHTHGGQIWPFDYLVKRRYPLLEGRYEIDNMTVIVSRGTGTWGPRMRLWGPGEILRIRLHRKTS